MVNTASLNELLYDIRRIEANREKLTEKKIEKIYQSLLKDLNKFIADEYSKYSDEDGRLYISYLDEHNRRAKFLQEIMENVDKISPALYEEMETLIDLTYSNCYSGMIKALKKSDSAGKLKDVAKDLAVNPHVLKQAINNNISKLTLPPILERYRNETIYQIQQELNLGLINGDRYDRMAKRISERVGVSYSKAKNIARTESHRNVESGFMDCAENIQSKLEEADIGLIYACTWRTMKDERVRPQQRRKTKKGWKTSYSKNGANHMKMEGQTVKVGDDFDLGGGVKAKAPSKSGVAAHDCNCRCFLEYNLLTAEEFKQITGKNVDNVKEKHLTKSENSDIIKLPESLKNFDEYQEQWVEDNFSKLSPKQRELLDKGVQKIIDNNAYSMRVHSKDLQNIIDYGFLNQMQTKTSGGTLSAADRKTASYRLFNNDAMHMKPSQFEKYGYLGSKDLLVDDEVSDSWQYGRTIIKFNKERLKNRVTYTLDDSLGNALYNRVIGGKIGDKPTISGIPKDEIGYVIDRFKYAEREDWYDADTMAQEMGFRYWELQFHGDLTINDVDSVCFTGRDKATDAIIEQLKKIGIKVYRIKGGELIDL